MRTWPPMLLALACGLLLSPSLLGQAKGPSDTSDDPEVERQLTQLPEGFEFQLVAAEPTVVNPLQMNFDSRGRLWVLCAPRYPQLLPGQEPKDYVVVLEDFDAKGHARKSHVFVAGLTVPTGMMPGDGGVYVGQGESLLHFRDTKGTGKADERRVLLTGFGTADTHHTLNTFRWGPDGALYFNQGLYALSTVETPYGPRQLFGGCIWQLRTDRLQLEVYDRSILPNNTWGHAFDAWGQSFVASAWPGALNLVLPDSPLHKTTNRDLVPDLKLTQIGGERHCGLEIVSGRHFPDDWQGNLLTGDFMSHRVYRYALHDDGQRFVAKLLPPLVVSRHAKFRPVDIKMGPDGAVYIADLYQQIIQHNQVNFRDPRRDHSRGRIWRIVRKDGPLILNANLDNLPLNKLLDHLKDQEQWTRLHTKRVLAERGRKADATGLAAWVSRLDPADANHSHHLLEALWAYQTIDHVEPELLRRLLRVEDSHVRAAATRVLGYWHERLPEALLLLSAQAADPSPRVRLEAILAAGRVPSARAVEAALRALDQPRDPLLDFALRRTTVLLRPYWYPEFQAGRLTFGGKGRPLSFALQAIRAPDAVPALTELFKAGKVPAENQADVLQILAGLGDPRQQAIAWQQSQTSPTLTAAERARLLEALEQAARSRKVKPPGELAGLDKLFADRDAAVGAAALRLAGAWKLEGLRTELQRLAGATKTDPPRRQAAVEALVDLGGPASLKALEVLTTGDHPYVVRQQAIVGLAALDTRQAVEAAGDFLKQAPLPGEDLAPLFTAFVRQKGGGEALAQVLKTRTPARDAARIGLRVLAGLGVPAAQLTTTLQSAAGQTGQRRQLSAAESKRLIGLVQQQGDPVRGEAVFRRPALGCMQCHAIGGAGGKVGPDLSGIGTSAQLDYLIESIILPSKVVREGYTTAHVFTKDGKAYSGIVQRESPTELVLRDPVREEIVIPVADIEEKKVGGSLMPDGLDLSLTDAELADLVRFLSELGRPGRFAVTHVRVARSWQYLAAPSEALLAQEDGALGKALHEDSRLSWTSLYSKVSGELPLREAGAAADAAVVLVRCQLEVTTPGRLTLAVNGVPGFKLWVDGRPTEARELVTLDLPRGRHALALRVDRQRQGGPHLRCELLDNPGSPAQAAFVPMK